MRYHALACDYDGTVASHGEVDSATEGALRRLKAGGRKLVLVTGRLLDDLGRVLPDLALFDVVVAENGGLLHIPGSRETRALAESPPESFVQALRARGVDPLVVGRTIVATREPHEAVVLDVIREQGLELHVIFNKGAVMILPSGVNKATGLDAALAELGLSRHGTIGVGDAENDHAFLARCACAVAVANALDALKERADLVTAGAAGVGTAELCERIRANDLADIGPALARHDLPLGKDDDGAAVLVPVYGTTLLVAGTSGGGKSTVVTGLLERMAEREVQHCIIDPEGDYASYEQAVVLGDARRAPTADEVLEVLDAPARNVAVNLLGLPLDQRPPFFATLLPRLTELCARVGRPHWIVVDEAHHLMPEGWDAGPSAPRELHSVALITVHPEHVAPAMLDGVNMVLAIGRAPDDTLRSFAEARHLQPPTQQFGPLEPGDVVAWWPGTDRPPRVIHTQPPRAERKRHVRKYAEGELPPDRSFYFRGPHGHLNLRAQNLRLFLQVADGVDVETWLFHLRRGDYSRWMREFIKDPGLADEVAAVERQAAEGQPGAAGGGPDAVADATRAAVRAAVDARYTTPA